MAKGHKFTQVSLWVGDKLQTIKNQNIRLRFHLEFTTKHDGDAVSTDHSAMFDVSMPWVRLLELAKNSIAIVVQNKILRPKSNDVATKWLRDHDPIKYEDAFPGKMVAKVLTPEENAELALGAAKSDKELRAKMIKDLMAMDDDNDDISSDDDEE